MDSRNRVVWTCCSKQVAEQLIIFGLAFGTVKLLPFLSLSFYTGIVQTLLWMLLRLLNSASRYPHPRTPLSAVLKIVPTCSYFPRQPTTMSSIPSSSVPLGNKRELEGDTLDSNAKRIKLDVPSSPEASSERVAAPSTALPTDMVDLVSARKALMEQDVGITAFIDPSLPGFIGILKSR